MSVKNVQERLDLIFEYTVGDKGDKKVLRNIRKILNKAETQITLDTQVFSSQLVTAYTQRKGKAPSKAIMGKYEKLTREIIVVWKTVIRKNRADYMMVNGKGKDKLVFIIHEGENKRKTPRDNYNLFRKKNQEITLKLIKLPEYNQLFHGRTKNKSGEKRQIFDVGHVYSVTEKGRAGLAAGLAQEQLTGEDGEQLTEADFTSPDQYDQLTKLSTGLGLTSSEVLKVAVSGTGIATKISLENRIFLELNSDTGNRKKSGSERQAGEEVRTSIETVIEKRYGSNLPEIHPATWKGSDSLEDHIGNLIVNTSLKKQMYAKGKAKNLTKFKKTPKTVNKTSTVSRKKAIPTDRADVYAAGITPEIAKHLPKQAKQNPEKGQGSNDFAIATAGLLAVKNAINKRLPEEVRRNMGRPALRNRTGRFADSTMIDSITPSARTLMVRYTYRLNPYETFENNGQRNWPRGYNPKPLISKSIRGLALSMFKITALTTRRV